MLQSCLIVYWPNIAGSSLQITMSPLRKLRSIAALYALFIGNASMQSIDAKCKAFPPMETASPFLLASYVDKSIGAEASTLAPEVYSLSVYEMRFILPLLSSYVWLMMNSSRHCI